MSCLAGPRFGHSSWAPVSSPGLYWAFGLSWPVNMALRTQWFTLTVLQQAYRERRQRHHHMLLMPSIEECGMR